jgi:hypothetical protein
MDREGAAVSWSAFNFDAAVMGFDNALRNRQS